MSSWWSEVLRRVGPAHGDAAGIREEALQASMDAELLQERVAELELALEDTNWMRLLLNGEREFSRDGLRKICELARIMYLKNPLIKRGVQVKTLYTWGQGVNIRAKDPKINQVLQDFWDDPKNQAELTGHLARKQKDIDLQVDGNIFFVFFTRPTDGRVLVRSIPVDEVSEIISDPEDAKTPWYYKRVWSETRVNLKTGRMKTARKTAYYPDWHYKPKAKAKKIGKNPVMWDTPIYHVKVGALSDWKFGLSEVYAAIDWARAYKEFLEDVASLMRSYSRFAWRMTLRRGGKKGLAAAKAKLQSTLGNSGSASETNPPPVTGSTFLGREGVDLQPMQLRGASISPDDGRRFLLMVAAAVGLPETYFGDVSVGTLATAKSMDRPTELAMRDRQTMWIDVLMNIFQFVLTQAVQATDGPLKGIARIDGGRIVWREGINSHLDVDFPPLLERDVQASVQAIVTAATMNGQMLAIFDEPTVARLLLSALAQDDVDEIMADLYPDEAAGNITDSTEALKRAAKRIAEAHYDD